MASLWFNFSGNLNQPGHLIDGDDEDEVRQKMDFDDLELYRQLLNENGCRRVQIASLCVQHNRYCHGINAVYRLTFNDGRTELRTGPEHFYASGYYSYHWRTPTVRTTIVMEEDEYLTGIIVNQGDILDGITFVTNKQRVHCGGWGGNDPVDMMTSIPPNMKVVAFCGTKWGVCSRIGFYSTNVGWQILGPHILMRQLVAQGRATILPPDEEGDLASVMHRLTTINDGVFGSIMSFLV